MTLACGCDFLLSFLFFRFSYIRDWKRLGVTAEANALPIMLLFEVLRLYVRRLENDGFMFVRPSNKDFSLFNFLLIKLVVIKHGLMYISR